MNELTELEGEALRAMIGEKGMLYSALAKFFENRSAKYDQLATAQLRERSMERACDYACRSEENLLMMAQLESFALNL